MEPVIIRQSQKRVLQSLIASVVALALFLAILLFDWEQTFELIRVLTVICLPVFSIASVYHLVQLIRREQPVLLLDAEGLEDRSVLFAPGKILWSEITWIKVIEYNNQPYLLLGIADPRALFRRLPLVRRIVLRIRTWFMRSGNNLPIYLQHVNQTPSQVLQTVRQVQKSAAGNDSAEGGQPDAQD